MHRPRPTGFDTLDLARQAAIHALELLRPAPPTMRALTDQTLRAVTSVPLNLAEGAGRCGRDRLHHWRIAYGSALEARTALDLLAAAGGVDAEEAATAEALLDRVSAMTWRLVHSAE